MRPSKERASAEYVSANVQKIQARERMYQDALTFAKQNGETSKVCRFERALHRIADMSRDAMAGKPVDLDDLPPQVATSAGKCSERDDQFQVKNQRAGTQQEMAVKESPSGVTGTVLVLQNAQCCSSHIQIPCIKAIGTRAAWAAPLSPSSFEF